MKMLVVCGNFDKDGGRKSGLFEKICNELRKNGVEVDVYNGGNVEDLKTRILPMVANYPVVLWGPNVPNTEEKMRNVKEINPKTILIATKRNNGEYDFAELISRALAQKSNLVLEFSRFEALSNVYRMRLFDPLGNLFFKGAAVDMMVKVLLIRLNELLSFTRIGSVHVDGPVPEVPNEEEFFRFARNSSDIFHNLINPAKGTTRFLGNMSFRCQNGFPSFRGKDNIIFVSQRNVDKRLIDASSFVPTYKGDDGKVMYYGEYKPSVDTPIQQRLYELFPQMNYMIHAHCYFDTLRHTSKPVPCGAVEEVDEIYNAVRDKTLGLIPVNLVGHGCILMARDARFFTRLMQENDSGFLKRPAPEDFTQEYFEKTL